jgi:hypothetical protein
MLSAGDEWSRLRLPQPPSASDLSSMQSDALLRFVINSMISTHAFSLIACSKSCTFRNVLYGTGIQFTFSLFSLSPHRFQNIPPPLAVSNRQRSRLLASGGLALLLISRIGSFNFRSLGNSNPHVRASAAARCVIARRIKGASAAVFVLGGGSSGQSRGGSGLSVTWPVLWPPSMMRLTG